MFKRVANNFVKNTRLRKTLFTSQKNNVHVEWTRTPEQLERVTQKTKRTATILAFWMLVGCPLAWKLSNSRTHLMEVPNPHYYGTRIRARPYGWFCYDCDLFDKKCHEHCRELEKKKKSLYEEYLKRHPEMQSN